MSGFSLKRINVYTSPILTCMLDIINIILCSEDLGDVARFDWDDHPRLRLPSHLGDDRTHPRRGNRRHHQVSKWNHSQLKRIDIW